MAHTILKRDRRVIPVSFEVSVDEDTGLFGQPILKVTLRYNSNEYFESKFNVSASEAAVEKAKKKLLKKFRSFIINSTDLKTLCAEASTSHLYDIKNDELVTAEQLNHEGVDSLPKE